MLDEFQRLRESSGLNSLLSHYVQPNEVNPEGWLDRLMTLDGAEPIDLVRWHGELIAFGWIEQNTGQTAGCREGAVTACYRSTPAGRRALRAFNAGDTDWQESVQPLLHLFKSKAKARPRKETKTAA